MKDTLDSGILERFRKQIYIPLPDGTTREMLFRSKLGEVEEEFTARLDFELLSNISDGLSGRDITFICDDFKYFLSELKSGICEDQGISEKMVSLIEERKNSKGI